VGEVASSNLVVPTILLNEPFEDHVEGPSVCRRYTYGVGLFHSNLAKHTVNRPYSRVRKSFERLKPGFRIAHTINRHLDLPFFDPPVARLSFSEVLRDLSVELSV
jgi:hypothetical protein